MKILGQSESMSRPIEAKKSEKILDIFLQTQHILFRFYTHLEHHG